LLDCRAPRARQTCRGLSAHLPRYRPDYRPRRTGPAVAAIAATVMLT